MLGPAPESLRLRILAASEAGMTNVSNDKAVSAHYEHGTLLAEIEAALGKLGKSMGDVTVADLAPVDEFHIGGRAATVLSLA